MKVLLTEGSGLTSRQVATRLGELGHVVEVLSSTRVCLTRFTRHVRAVHLVPAFGATPLAWLDAALTVAKTSGAELLFPTQEQVAVLAAAIRRVSLPTIVPRFAALARVQDRLEAFRTLRAAGVPCPNGEIVQTRGDLDLIRRFPVYVKNAVSTASSGVRFVTDRAALERAYEDLGGGPLLVQDQSVGPLAMVQALAQDGRLIAVHAVTRIKEGIGGGASIKESFRDARIEELAHRLVEHLCWHGPISFDVICTDAGPLVIDVNPRLVEPRNAWLAGVDLVGMMLSIAHGDRLHGVAVGRAGVRTHQLLLAELRAAREGRLALVRELTRVLTRTGEYATSDEELTPTGNDGRSMIPTMVVGASALLWPATAAWFTASSTSAYALTPRGWSTLVRHAE